MARNLKCFIVWNHKEEEEEEEEEITIKTLEGLMRRLVVAAASHDNATLAVVCNRV